MRRFLFLGLLFLLSVSAVAKITNNGDGTSTFEGRGSNSYITGICEYSANWVGGAGAGGPATCDGLHGSKTYVQLGICTQEEADNGDELETSACTQNLVDNKVCTASQMATGVVIPDPQKCALLADWVIKNREKTIGLKGLDLLDRQRNPDPEDNDDGDVEDPE